MDFFEHQDQARRATAKLVVLFALAVFGIVASVNVVALVGFHVLSADDGSTSSGPAVLDIFDLRWYRPWVMLGATAVAAAVMGERMLNKTLQLRGGGPAVAAMLGGRPLDERPRDANGRRLRNVVEEMAIAAGLPVPQVWVLDDEPAINAFAAGHTRGDSVIGVTRGCVERLTRDELQGVVAHEIAHVLHGDSRLNLRLIGALAGIFGIGLIGFTMLRSLSFSGGSRYSRRRKGDDGRAALLIFAGGLALACIGYVGVLFGRLIQSAISRQREYLADAAAVQFTRNPAGLAGALKKIGGHAGRGRVRNAHAGEAAHLFFANGFSTPLGKMFGGAFATHPPLADRIRRLDPQFDGRWPKPIDVGATGDDAKKADTHPVRRREPVELVAAAALVGGAGRVTPEAVAWAAAFVDDLPPALAEAVHDPYLARAVVLALLMDPDDDLRARQAALVANLEGPLVADVGRLWPFVTAAGPGARLPVELCLPTLGRLSELQAANLCRMLREVIDADAEVSVSEFALYNVVRRHLSVCGEEEPAGGQVHSLNALLDPARVLLSALAERAGDAARARASYAAGLRRLDPRRAASGGSIDEPVVGADMNRVGQALEQLDAGSPAVKRRVLDAAAHAVGADGLVTLAEAELLRGVAAALGVPMPAVPGVGGGNGASLVATAGRSGKVAAQGVRHMER